MLRFVNGKPLGDILTEILNDPNKQTVCVLEMPSLLREPEQLLPEVNLIDPVVASLDDKKIVQHSPHKSYHQWKLQPHHCLETSFRHFPEIHPSFLSKLFEDELDNTANLQPWSKHHGTVMKIKRENAPR